MKRPEAPFTVDDWIAAEGDAGRFARVRAIYWSRRWGAWVADLVIFNADGTVRHADAREQDLLDYCRIDPPVVPLVGYAA